MSHYLFEFYSLTRMDNTGILQDLGSQGSMLPHGNSAGVDGYLQLESVFEKNLKGFLGFWVVLGTGPR